ncbi:hypothetical protein Moror_12248 [Moniliophthora roreri MCA 2997]|nr:hypothetical protein Moror_12248 [Moniliophthora roreri MCA 2997]
MTAASISQLQQSTLDAHLAMVEWLITTNQLLCAFEHPKFKNMIDIASRATNGVNVPGYGAACCEIVDMF